VKLNGHQAVHKLEVKGPTPHGFKGPGLRMGQSGSKPLADECFTATFGLWNPRKNVQKAGQVPCSGC
jgi:hypothetical protein